MSEKIIENLDHNNHTDHGSDGGIVLRDSNHYKLLLLMDQNDISKLKTWDEKSGLLVAPFQAFRIAVRSSSEGYFSLLFNGSLLLLTVGIPVFILLFLLLFWRSSSNINENLLMIKQILLLMPKKFLLKKHIFNYVMGYSSFSFAVNKENQINCDLMTKTLMNVGVPVVIFDKKFNIINLNNVAHEMFGMKETKLRSLKEILDVQSINKVKIWLKKPTTANFSEELVCTLKTNKINNSNLKSEEIVDYTFRVYADMCRNKEYAIALMENIENQRKKKILQIAEKKSEKTEELLKNILPESIAKVLKLDKKEQIISVHKQVSAVFADICNFTAWSSQQLDAETFVTTLNRLFSSFDDLCEDFGLEKIKTIGDCYFAVCGVPNYVPGHAEKSVQFAIALIQFMEVFNKENGVDLSLRVGISSGKVVAGILGKRKWQYDVWGSCINEASRMESLGMKNKIQISRSTYEYVFDKFEFIEKELMIQGIGMTTTYIINMSSLTSPRRVEDEENTIKKVEKIEKVEEMFSGKNVIEIVENEKERDGESTPNLSLESVVSEVTGDSKELIKKDVEETKLEEK